MNPLAPLLQCEDASSASPDCSQESRPVRGCVFPDFGGADNALFTIAPHISRVKGEGIDA
jgi:hypothetical protein